MVGQRDGAVLALDLFAAGAAHDDERVAAAVEQDDDLLAAVERGLRFFDELAGEDAVPGRSRWNSVRMSTSSTAGSGRSMHAVEHLDAGVAAALGVGPGFERGRGGAEDDDGVVELGAHHGDVAAVVARRLFLLVAGVVLLVDEDEAEVGHGREDGGARADDDAGLAAADAVPLLGALVGRERGVQQGDLGAEGGEHLRRPWRG